jgi:hypothetical protein
MMAVYQHGDVWWYRLQWQGRLIRNSAHVDNKRDAEQTEAAKRTALAKGEVGIREKKPTPTLAEFAPRFTAAIETVCAEKPATVSFYKARLKALLSELGDKRLEEHRGVRNRAVHPDARQGEIAAQAPTVASVCQSGTGDVAALAAPGAGVEGPGPRAADTPSAWFPGESPDSPIVMTSLDHQHDDVRTALKLPEDFVVHSLRHTMLTRLGEAGADAFAIMRIAGRSSVTVSQRYVHPTPEGMERAFERLQELSAVKFEQAEAEAKAEAAGARGLGTKMVTVEQAHPRASTQVIEFKRTGA